VGVTSSYLRLYCYHWNNSFASKIVKGNSQEFKFEIKSRCFFISVNPERRFFTPPSKAGLGAAEWVKNLLLFKKNS
jgi:hypothetical protein